MAHIWKSAIAAGIAGLLVACGGGGDDRGAGQTQKASEQPQTGADEMARGLESMAKGLGALAGGDPNAKTVDPVGFRDLMAVFPEEFSGWRRSKPTGERMSSPVNFSQAEVRYTKGDAELDLRITDSGLNQILIAPFAMMLTSGYEKETENGYEKSVKVGDYPGWEKWNGAGKDGELNAIVNKRFMVQVEGRNIDDPKAMHSLLAATKLGNLGDSK